MKAQLLVLCLHFLDTTSSLDTIRLNGVGASFPADVYESWSSAFENDRQNFVKLDHEYYGVGSGLGKDVITGEVEWSPVTYVASDSLLTEADYEANPLLQMVPIMAG